MTLTGTAGSTIPAGTVFLTLEGLEFALLEDVLLTGGSDTGTAEATEIGSAYNVEAGAITRMVTTMTALSAWTNASATGGTDQESDAALYERIRDFRAVRPPLAMPITMSSGPWRWRAWAARRSSRSGMGRAR